MTVQVQNRQKGSGRKWKRFTFMSIALLLLLGIAIVWIVNATSLLSSVLSIVFTLLGVMLTLLQWPSHSQSLVRGVSSRRQRQKPFYEEIEDIGLEVNTSDGALIVYTGKSLRGSCINLCTGFHNHNLKAALASSVIGRKRKGSLVFLAVFPSLGMGNYTVYTDSQEFLTKVSVLPGRVGEVDW